VKAGGGHIMTIGEVATHFLSKLEWYSTLFPRIPVPIQKQIEQNLLAKKADRIRASAAAASQGRGDVNRPSQQEDRYNSDINYTTLHLFNGLFSATAWVSRHQKGEPFWILMK